MNICVIGGGHIGTTMAAEMACLRPENHVRMLTSKPEMFFHDIKVIDVERKASFIGSIPVISDDPLITVAGADLIFVTVPAFLIWPIFSRIKPYLKPGVYIGIIPGYGGGEFVWKEILQGTSALFGFQRVPYIARLIEYGKESELRSRKPDVTVGAIPREKLDEICELLEKECGFCCKRAPNYLAVTLTPTNPVLHTARIFDLFHGSLQSTVFAQRSMFYSEWTDFASEMLLGVDRELQLLIKDLNEIDLSSVKPLREHYESPTVQALTTKIKTIPSFQLIGAPLKEVTGGFSADVSSRLFIEDFPFGLCILKGFCDICRIPTPYMDEELQWYASFMELEYFVAGRFSGKDLAGTGIPQNYGLVTKQDVLKFYTQ